MRQSVNSVGLKLLLFQCNCCIVNDDSDAIVVVSAAIGIVPIVSVVSAAIGIVPIVPIVSVVSVVSAAIGIVPIVSADIGIPIV